jgi:cell filamentation protein, protein adenylyltransferase
MNDQPNSAVRYVVPDGWIKYDTSKVLNALVDAKATVISLKATPFQRDWVDELQRMQLKMEVAGTSRIEGADFTENELDAAINTNTPPADLFTRSQRQARSAAETYRWIADVPDDQPISAQFVREVHMRMVEGCDDDHCPPGKLRAQDVNVTFGFPRHRGCEGGKECERIFTALMEAVARQYREHDPLIQAIALHYHFAAMHPFLDGNGRTARALEALMLQRSGLRDTAFIAMSNFYYEEKQEYLKVLAEVRRLGHDLTPFILFGLRGVTVQCQRLFAEIKKGIQKAIFKTTMYDLFKRLESPRKRVLAKRQLHCLKVLLEADQLDASDFVKRVRKMYEEDLRNPYKAMTRDVNALINLGAVTYYHDLKPRKEVLAINLDWPEEITETEFVQRIEKLPQGRQFSFL